MMSEKEFSEWIKKYDDETKQIARRLLGRGPLPNRCNGVPEQVIQPKFSTIFPRAQRNLAALVSRRRFSAATKCQKPPAGRQRHQDAHSQNVWARLKFHLRPI